MADANSILSYQSNPENALAEPGSGLAPGVIQWNNALPAWINAAQDELRLREAQYKKHLADIADAKAKAEKDTTFDYSKVRPGDIQGFVEDGQRIKKEAYANAVKIMNEPNSPEALKINNDIARHLATVNQSAQAYAMVNKAIDKSNTNPDAFDERFDEEISVWNSLPPDQAAQYVPKFNTNVSLDLLGLAGDIRNKTGLDQVKGSYAGYDATTGNFKFSDSTTVNQQSLDSNISLAWQSTKGSKAGQTVADRYTKKFDVLTPQQKVADIYTFLTPEDLAAEGLAQLDGQGNVIPNSVVTPDKLTAEQADKLIQTYAPDAQTNFRNHMVASAGGSKLATTWRTNWREYLATQFGYFKERQEFTKPLGSEAIDVGLELFDPNSARWDVDKGAEGKYSHPPGLYYTVNGQTIDGFVTKGGKLFAIPNGDLKGKGDDITWDSNTLIPVTDYYSQVYTPYIDVRYKTSGADDKERAAVYASKVDKNNTLKVPQPAGVVYEDKKQVGTSKSSGGGTKMKAIPPIPTGFTEIREQNGKLYFVNSQTKQVQLIGNASEYSK